MKRKGRVDEALSTQSRYCYPGTTILINNFDIKTQEELDIAERRITTLMLATLQLKNTPKINTLLTTKYYLNYIKKYLDQFIVLLEKPEMKIYQKEIHHFVDQNISIVI